MAGAAAGAASAGVPCAASKSAGAVAAAGQAADDIADITGVTAEFDRLATEIQTNEYTGAVDRLGWLEARLTKLTTELAKAHNDADQAHRRELLLAERLEASESGQQA